ncbi:ABC transporter permease [Ruminococcus sp. 5_1_39BFAA]|uniref:ABC transporter permease n=1 Tax=Ruminococcus sp. 5_1_39BFAA TaxID=457412 RepID=UPI003564DE0C
MENFKNNPLVKKIGFNRLVLIGVMILMYIVFSIGSGRILGYANIMSAMNYMYFLGFLTLGVTFVIATGGIDFSIGPVMFCAALIGGRLLVKDGVPVVVALLVCILVGAIFGVANGFLVAYMELPSFISSMALMMLAKGVGSVFTSTQSISWPQAADESGNGWFRNLIRLKVGGTNIPTGLIWLLIVAVICAIILNNTKVGRYILCLGSNKEAVRLSGVNVKKWEMIAYIICGTLAGMAAIAYVGAYTTVSPGLGDNFNNEAIASCVMGGTSMSGGIASIGGSIIGVMIISLLQEGILAMGFQKDYQYVITGIIVLLAVYADVRSRRRKN